MILALTSGLSAFCPAGNQLQLLTAAPHDTATQRFNDGRCDPRGRFWVGSMPASERVPTGALYRFDADLSAHEVMTGLTIPNSLAWNLDGTTMFFADTLRATICAYDYQLETGEIGPERVFASTAERRGRPDGATVDEEGFLWSAEFDGWCLTRYGPDGNVDRHVPLPVQCPTSCAFGGVKLDTLYVTTARHRLTETEQQHQPLAGALLALDVGVRGRIEPEFAG